MALVKEVWGDVFAYPTSIAHAVSKDFHMSAGIALGFREYFGRVEELKDQQCQVGQVAYLQHSSHYIFYLITKENYWDKCINLDAVLSCLVHLKHLCEKFGVQELSMPRIGCGLDLLKFCDVRVQVLAAFHDSSVRVNIVTPPPSFHKMAVIGDSQGVRFLLNRGKLPEDFQLHPHPRVVGLSESGATIDNLINKLNTLPNSSLGDVLVFIGTNDLLGLVASGRRADRRALRGKWNALRTTLSMRVKACCRAVVTTVPPLPKILYPASAEGDKALYLWRQTVNSSLMELHAPRFHVLDLEPLFMPHGVIREDLFEKFMGHGQKQRQDRIHINAKGMDAIEAALATLPPFNP